MSNLKSTTATTAKKESFSFSIEKVTKSTQSKNFFYDSLYNFIAVQRGKTFLSDTEKKELRKKLQKIDLDNNFISGLILSGFVRENINKQKYEQIKPQIDSFNNKYDLSK